MHRSMPVDGMHTESRSSLRRHEVGVNLGLEPRRSDTPTGSKTQGVMSWCDKNTLIRSQGLRIMPLLWVALRCVLVAE